MSIPSKLYRRLMEHFRVTTKLCILSTFACLAAAYGGQRLPIALRFPLALWDVFAASPFANRLRPCGACLLDGLCKSSPRHISTGRLHALRRFHSPPINLIVFEVPYRITP